MSPDPRPGPAEPVAGNGERRVVITGIGVVAPGGAGTRAFWNLLVDGRTATRPISHFDASGFRSRIAAECDFDPARHGLTPQEIRRMDRAAQFAVVSAREALADAGLSTAHLVPERIGVRLGSAVGCTIALEQEYLVVSNGGRDWLVDPQDAVPHLYGYLVPSTLAVEVAWAVGAEGPVALVSTGCTSGLDAVGHGAALMRDGRVDVVVAGATEAPISPITVACFDAIKATSPNNDDPAHACRPFDRDRDGFALGEGAAVLILEEAEHARRRGVEVYAEVAGVAHRGNAYHMTGLKPDGREMAEAIRATLDRARMTPDDVDYVNAHGSGTKTERPARDRRVQGEPARARLPGTRQLDQIDGRPFAGRHRFDRAGGLRAGHPPPGGTADGQPAHPRPRVRPGLHPVGRAGAAGA